MIVEVYGSHNHVIGKELRHTQSVVIDILRATSVMVTAFNNGCRQIIPVNEIGEAMNLRRRIGESGVLLGGERDCLKIPGFDMGNSPKEYSKNVVNDKTIVLTTTNGTEAIHRVQSSKRVFIGAMLNASAVADKLLEWGDHTTIVCAGTRGKYTLDDSFAAGCILNKLMKKKMDVQVDDFGYSCLELYKNWRRNYKDLLKNASHYNALVKAGFEEDIDYCFQEDKIGIVPQWTDSMIML